MAKSTISASDREDMQLLIRMVLDAPIKKAPLKKMDGYTDIESFKKANTDVKTRMILQISIAAMQGDLKSAQFLMKYGGLEPVKEAHLTVETPTFIDDVPINITPAPQPLQPVEVQSLPEQVPLVIDRPAPVVEQLPLYDPDAEAKPQ